MKIVGVISSANFNGNSASLVRAALKGAEAEGALTTEIFLAHHKVDFCAGCLKCIADGQCLLPDDFESLRRILGEADGIIVGTPTFGYAPNARMKNFLDRFGLFEYFTSSLGGKYWVSISTASRASAARKTAAGIPRLFSKGVFQRGYVSGILGAKAQRRGTPVGGMDLEKALALGTRLAADIRRGKKYRAQHLTSRLVNKFLMRPNFRSVILKHREDMMKGVFANLSERGLIEEPAPARSAGLEKVERAL